MMNRQLLACATLHSDRRLTRSLLAAVVGLCLAASPAVAAFCDGDEDTLCPPATNPCTISGTRDVGADCTLDFTPLDVIVTGTLKAEVTGGDFRIVADDLTLNGGVVRSRGDSDVSGGTITLDVLGTFGMEGSGPSVDVSAAAGGGVIDITAAVIDLTKGDIKSDGSGGEDCEDGGEISLTATGNVNIDNIITANVGADCAGGDIDVVGASINLLKRIEGSGGDQGFTSVNLTATTGDLILGAASQIKTNGSSFDGDGGAGGSISLIAERGNVTVGGLIDATGATPDGSGGTVEVSSAGLVQIDGTIDTDGKGTGSDGGGIELEGQNGVTVSSSGNVEASGGSANGGDISLTGLVGTIAGDVIATASNGGNGGAISLLHCSVTLSGKLDVGASGGGLAGATAISARAVHLTTTGQLLAGSCAAGTDCHVFTLNDAVNLMDDGATITGGHQVVEDASQSLCCGNGAVDHVDEECDDGNASFCDGCTPSCAQEGSPVCPDDGNFCTDEICDAVEGCIVQPTLCPSDNIGCTDDCHSTLGCVPTPNDAACSDGNPCSMDQCDPGAGDPMTGCLYSNEPDGLVCKDGDPCTTADTCQAGLCTPGPPACCDDSNPCTADSCSPTKGCVNTEQGILCPSCAGQPAGTPCTDGNQNTIGDMCNGAGACAPGVPRLCDDGNACTLDFILSGICGHSDVLLCPAVCTNQPDGTPCSDQNVCTVGTCQSGVCVNVPISCGDSDPLNGEDDCAQSPLLPPGCVSTFPLSNCGGPICGNGLVEIGEDCDDGGTAPGDCCSATCSYEAVGSPCPDDGNLCTNEACDGAGVCTHPNNSDPCDDGDACTEDDTCSTGACGGSAVDCDDTDPCTTDTCDTGAGCQHDPIPGCGSDLDADGKVDAADECTTLSHSTPPASPPDQNPSRAALSLKNLDRPAGEQKVTAKGFWNPAVASPPIDPAANGIHFYLEDASGSFYSVSVPGGAVGAPGLCDPSDGWTTAASNTKTIWKYRNKSGAFPPACAAGSANGISKVQIKDLTSSSKAAYQMKVSAKDATFTAIPAAPLSRMQMSIAMAAQPSPGTAGAEAISGQCAEFLVTGAPIPTGGAKPFCKVTTSSGAARTISCKGP